jgi:hypothetical protein
MSSATLTEGRFFLLTSLAVALAGGILLRHLGAAEIVLAALTVVSAGFGAYALYRTLQPLAASTDMEAPVLAGGRTRLALERDKVLTLRSIKELEFDRAMGKVSEGDFAEMRNRLRARALRLIQQLEGTTVYRDRIEKDLESHFSNTSAAPAPAGALCTACQTSNDADARFCKMCGHALIMLLSVLVWLGIGTPPVSAQMPDVRSMSGLAMPAPELPDGTVTVRIVRGDITNNVAGVDVELHGAGPVRTAKTGPDGRAQFTGVPSGTAVHAAANVDGEQLESSEFQVPARGGVRTLLAAGAAAPPAAPPQAGESTATPGAAALSIGPNSRIAVEFSEDTLQVFYLLDVVNRSGAALNAAAPLVLDMPAGAQATTVLEGSTRQATAAGARVTVTGPFAPGITPLQIAYRLEGFGDSLTISQAFPLPVEMVTTAVQKVGDMRVTSPQVSRTQEAPIQGNTFLMGTGPALAAGTPLVLALTGLPHHDRAPVWLALALVAVIVGLGVWLAISPARTDEIASRRRHLAERRDEGLAALAALEKDHRHGRIDAARYDARRTALVGELERVYAALDEREDQAATRDVA